MSDSGNKTEQATPKRRRETRQKGQVARSVEIGAAVNMIAGFGALALTGGFIWGQSRRVFEQTLGAISAGPLDEAGIFAFLQSVGIKTVVAMLPVLAVVAIMAVAANYLQVGYEITTEAIQPKWEKLNPVEGFKKFFNSTAWIELAKSLVKIGLAGTLVWVTLRERLPEIVGLANVPLVAGLTEVGSLLTAIIVRLCLLFVLVGIADYAWQKYQFERRIKMSKQEVKDEYRQNEGDPLVKSKRRAKHRKLAMSRMAAEVARADVVTTNPTHYAVALKYDQFRMRAPRVVAKGENLWAKLIIRIARKHMVPVIENKPVARALYKHVEVGQEIPPMLYRAVAELLAALYKLRARGRRGMA